MLFSRAGIRASAHLTLTVVAVAALTAAAIAVVAARPAEARPLTVGRQISAPFPLPTDPPDGVSQLPAGPAGAMVVDGTRGHVFMSTGCEPCQTGSVIVTDLAGTVVTTISNLPNPRGMALSADGATLYVALTGANAISSIDLASLTERNRTSTGAGTCPVWLATAASRLWVSYGCMTWFAPNVSAVDPTATIDTLSTPTTSRYPSVPRLATASPTSPSLFVAWTTWNASLVDEYDVSGGSLVLTHSRHNPEQVVDGSDQLAVSPDGTTLFFSGWSHAGQLPRAGVLALAASDLSGQGFYDTRDVVAAIAVSADSRHLAVSMASSYHANFMVFPVGHFTATHSRTYGNVFSPAVAWNPAGDRAYLEFGPTPTLHLLNGLGTDPGQINVTRAVGPVAPGTAATVTGTLVTTDGTSSSGASVTVARSGPDGTAALPSVATGPSGGFRVTDTPPGPGGYTYRFTWPGDGSHPPATASSSVQVQGASPVALTAPAPGSGSDHDLGLARFGGLVVDELHGHVLVSGQESNSVAVLDLNGNRVATIDNLRGAYGLVLSRDSTTLYVALASAGAIAAVDTATLLEVGRWRTSPMAEVPEFLGEAGQQVFFGYRSSLVSNDGWGSFQEWAPANVATWDLVEGPVSLTTFATTPSNSNLLVTPSGAAVFRFDASTTPPTVVARTWETSLDFDSRLSPDGTKLLTEGVSVTDAVSPQPTPLPTLPNYQDSSDISYAGAYSADGQYVAAGGVTAGANGSQSTVKIWPEAGTSALRAIPVAGTIQSLGLAFTSDSSRVFAVTADDVSGGHPVLHVRNWPVAPKAPWSWGWNGVGQLGNGGLNDAGTAISIPTGLVAVTAGWFHDLGVAGDGSVWAWGWNATGQLGDGTTVDRLAPVKVTGLPRMVAVAAGELHSLALAGDGTVWSWGWNEVGQLGTGNTVDTHRPVPVAGLHDIVAIAAGAHHSLALGRDGTVWAWGWNGAGQLGDGTTVDRHAPVKIAGVSNVRSIAAGVLHTVASDANLQAWAWGGNHFGQLGIGTTTDSHVPVLVSSISGVRSVAAGGYHSIAVALLGTVSTWGWNGSGQLGDGTTIDRHTPVGVPGLYSGVTRASGGLAHTAVVANGTVLTWGWNTKGQLGNGTTVDGHAFGPVAGLANPVTVVAAGALHTVAL